MPGMAPRATKACRRRARLARTRAGIAGYRRRSSWPGGASSAARVGMLNEGRFMVQIPNLRMKSAWLVADDFCSTAAQRDGLYKLNFVKPPLSTTSFSSTA